MFQPFGSNSTHKATIKSFSANDIILTSGEMGKIVGNRRGPTDLKLSENNPLQVEVIRSIR